MISVLTVLHRASTQLSTFRAYTVAMNALHLTGDIVGLLLYMASVSGGNLNGSIMVSYGGSLNVIP